MKNINWKASARFGTLQVNQYDPTAQHRLMILLNVDTKLNQWTVTDEPERIEYGISVAATLLNMPLKCNRGRIWLKRLSKGYGKATN